MLKAGLVSISFRQLSVEEIIELVKRTGLTGIEWGGDVHVPHGDIDTATKVRNLTEKAGLECPAYGSYYRVGESEKDGLTFQQVLNSALALQTPVIRVWAGKQGSDKADDQYWQTVVEDSKRIADMAAGDSVRIAYEYHRNTLTDTNEAAHKLLALTDHSNLFSYWQPPIDTTFEYRLAGLKALGVKLSNIHVYHWVTTDGNLVKRPLTEGSKDWSRYLDIAVALPGDRYAMLEFVEDNDPENLIRDAATLVELVKAAN